MYNDTFSWYDIKMNETRIGFVGWRGMVGSVLRERMMAEGDFDGSFKPVFLSTSQAGQEVPVLGDETYLLGDAYDLTALRGLQAIVTCQGSEYTREVYGKLRESGWDGYWIDASSELRQAASSILISDVVNRRQMEEALDRGVKELVGPNCSSNILLMGAAGLFTSGVVERVTFTTNQAVSGKGAEAAKECLRQDGLLSAETAKLLRETPGEVDVLEAMREATQHLRSGGLPTREFGAPIRSNALNVIGEIDKESGQTSEEKKAQDEINKILGNEGDNTITMDGNCIRIDSIRSHAIAARLELNKDIPLGEIERMITGAHEWVKLVPNKQEDIREHLTPLAVSETLDIAVGRVRKMSHGPKDLNIYVVGDQLLWGAAEPLRRALRIVLDHL